MQSRLPTDDDNTMNSKFDYTRYWGLRALPFDNVPDPRFYVPCLQHDAAHRWLSYGIQTGKGMLLLTGDVGCGKTLLSRRLIAGLSPTRYDVAIAANPALSPSELLDEVLSQFGLSLVRSKAGRLQTLNARLELNAQRGISSVLVVDEARTIESVKGFEDLRLLTNFQLNDRFLLTVVLIGQPELRHRVGNSAVEPADRGPCASGSFHDRRDDVIYYGSHGSRDRSDRRVYERGDSSDIRAEQGDREAH